MSKLPREFFTVLDGTVDLGSMRKVVGQRCVDISKLQVELAGYFVGAQSNSLMPDSDMLDGDTAASDTRFAAEHAWPRFNALIETLRGHVEAEQVNKALLRYR